MLWEEECYRAAIRVLKPHSRVLQLGFDHDYAAKAVQQLWPKSHTIIEADPQRVEQAEQFAKGYSEVRVIAGQWQEVLKTLGEFDAIFFQGLPLQEQWKHIRELKSKDFDMEEKKQLYCRMQQQMAQFSQLRFTEKDFDEFYQTVGQYNLHEVPHFLEQLRDNGQITPKVYAAILHKYPGVTPKEPAVFSFSNTHDPLLLLLQECLSKHMSLNARFTSLSVLPLSKYEEASFFAHIITHPHLHFDEEWLSLTAKERPFEKLLIFTVEKRGMGV
jgi:hypothetical protein